jgi:hypothetical protein
LRWLAPHGVEFALGRVGRTVLEKGTVFFPTVFALAAVIMGGGWGVNRLREVDYDIFMKNLKKFGFSSMDREIF